MPRAEDLPGPLQPLSRRNAFEITAKRFAEDIGRLIDEIDDYVTGAVELDD